MIVDIFIVTGGMKGGRSTNGLLYQASGLHPDGEMLAISGQTLRLAKNLHDNGFGMFRTMLLYKLEERGKVFVKIDRRYPSSKLCRHCGYVHTELGLNERKWTCPSCGAELDRDHNAAINIREAGKQLLVTA